MNNILLIYYILEALLFVAIKWAEWSQPYSVTGKVMYAAILLNSLLLFYVCMGHREELRVREKRKMVLALTMTLIADYFLTLTNTHFAFGVFCFVLVQILYAWKTGCQRQHILGRAVLILCYGTTLYLLGMRGIILLLCASSIGLLTGNVILAFKGFRASGDRWDGILALGLLAFMFCDLSIGFRNMNLFYEIMYYSTWVFYLPAQVLLTTFCIREISGESLLYCKRVV